MGGGGGGGGGGGRSGSRVFVEEEFDLHLSGLCVQLARLSQPA